MELSSTVLHAPSPYQCGQYIVLSIFRVDSVLEKSLKMPEFIVKHARVCEGRVREYQLRSGIVLDT